MPKGHYPLPSVQPTIYGCPQVSPALSWRHSCDSETVRLTMCLFCRAGMSLNIRAIGLKKLLEAERKPKRSVRVETALCCISWTCECVFISTLGLPAMNCFCTSKAVVTGSVAFCRYEQAHFTALMGRYSGDWWIGLRARGGVAGVDYYWDNDALITYTNWGRNEPSNSTQPFCPIRYT